MHFLSGKSKNNQGMPGLESRMQNSSNDFNKCRIGQTAHEEKPIQEINENYAGSAMPGKCALGVTARPESYVLPMFDDSNLHFEPQPDYNSEKMEENSLACILGCIAGETKDFNSDTTTCFMEALLKRPNFHGIFPTEICNEIESKKGYLSAADYLTQEIVGYGFSNNPKCDIATYGKICSALTTLQE